MIHVITSTSPTMTSGKEIANIAVPPMIDTLPFFLLILHRDVFHAGIESRLREIPEMEFGIPRFALGM
jgi:hypothetical protein